MFLLTLSLLSFAPTLAQAPTPAIAQEAQAAVPFGDYYIVTHIDTRRCAAPMCGGVFVRSVNLPRTRCADGTWQQECHVYTTDLNALGLDPSTQEKFLGRFAASKALIRGLLVQDPSQQDFDAWPVDTLRAHEAWNGVTGNVPRGSFAQVEDNGLRCLVEPCESFTATYLNTTRTRDLAGVDLAASGASDAQVQAGMQELFDDRILLAGSHYWVTGPGGWARAIRATEFYHRIESNSSCSAAADTCAGNSYCSIPTGTCDNTPGTCAEMPQACIEIYDPVCGCDGVTYGNSCLAAQLGMNIAYNDACATCQPMQAKGVGPCDRFFGYAHDGNGCVPISGCSCEGSDCDNLFQDLAKCEASCESGK